MKKNSDINHINKNKKNIFFLLLLFLLIIIKCCFLCVIVFFLLKRVREHLYNKFIVVILNLKVVSKKVIILKIF